MLIIKILTLHHGKKIAGRIVMWTACNSSLKPKRVPRQKLCHELSSVVRVVQTHAGALCSIPQIDDYEVLPAEEFVELRAKDFEL
ncbi:hypothetical protein TWF225_008486 [Orbilia oligospora]|nr:hypothetical protein TWF225_008486 [Orbilia oligospora]